MSFELSKGNEKEHAFSIKHDPSIASHSRFVYGKPVDTCRPYPCGYMSECYLNVFIVPRH